LPRFAHEKSYENSSLRPLALLLYAELAELRRADKALQQQTTKAKDEQRRADTLRQKREAILDMEMKMIERGQSTPPKKK
jgi:hypothetical protein